MSKKTRKKKNNSKMLLTGFSLIVVFIGIIFVLVTKKPPYPLHDGKYQVRFDTGLGINEEWQMIIYSALQEWDQKYHCETDIQISRLVGFTDQIDKDGEVFHTVAIALPGRIGFNFPTIRGKEDLYYVTIHEATHACRKPERILDKPLIFTDPSFNSETITGFTGFIVSTENGPLNLCDEALAEYNALNLQPSYIAPHPGYKMLGEWLLNKFPNNTEIMKMGKRNDFEGFVALYYQISRSEVTITEIQNMLHECGHIFEEGIDQQ